MLSRSVIGLFGRRGYGLLKANPTHSYSSSTPTTQVVVADDGRTLVCWHPEPEFPYEQTLPLPKEADSNKSVIKCLNDTHIRDVSHLEGMKEELAREQLMKITFTTKHKWFPHVQKKKAKKTPMDRPYL